MQLFNKDMPAGPSDPLTIPGRGSNDLYLVVVAGAVIIKQELPDGTYAGSTLIQGPVEGTITVLGGKIIVEVPDGQPPTTYYIRDI